MYSQQVITAHVEQVLDESRDARFTTVHERWVTEHLRSLLELSPAFLDAAEPDAGEFPRFDALFTYTGGCHA